MGGKCGPLLLSRAVLSKNHPSSRQVKNGEKKDRTKGPQGQPDVVAALTGYKTVKTLLRSGLADTHQATIAVAVIRKAAKQFSLGMCKLTSLLNWYIKHRLDAIWTDINRIDPGQRPAGANASPQNALRSRAPPPPPDVELEEGHPAEGNPRLRDVPVRARPALPVARTCTDTSNLCSSVG